MHGLDAITRRADAGTAELRHAVWLSARRAQLLGKDSLTFADKVRLAYWNAFQHDCLNTAKATAYSAIFAVFPMLGVAAAVVSMLPYTGPVRTQLAMLAYRTLPESVVPLFEHYFQQTPSTRQSAGVLLIGLVIAVSGAAGVLSTLMEGFRRAYHLNDDCWGIGWRGSLRQWLQSYLLVPIALVPMAAASGLIVFGHFMLLELMSFTPTGWDRGLYWTANVIRWVGSLSTAAAVLAFIYRFAVPVKPAWRAVLPGAAFATVTWFLSTLAFGWYVTKFTHYSKVYGSLGTGVVLLLWLFLTSLTVLCGAELNAELGRERVKLPPAAAAASVVGRG